MKKELSGLLVTLGITAGIIGPGLLFLSPEPHTESKTSHSTPTMELLETKCDPYKAVDATIQTMINSGYTGQDMQTIQNAMSREELVALETAFATCNVGQAVRLLSQVGQDLALLSEAQTY